MACSSKKSNVQNWNRYPSIDACVKSFRTAEELRTILKTTPKLIARGAGLSYGDASLASCILSTLKYNKILEFDSQRGTIKCESGVTLDDLLQVIVPAGWFLPVTPGTKFITLGGAVAADVHGKNHHKEGSLGRYVNKLTIMLGNGEIVSCNKADNADIFNTTCGGMGLTGVILEVELRLKKIQTSIIAQKNFIARNVFELLNMLKETDTFTYSVAWIDCLASGKHLGRGVLMLGEHASLNEIPLKYSARPLQPHAVSGMKVSFDLPRFALSAFSIGVFNRVYYQWHALAKKEFFVHYDNFFYPLDFVKYWNRLYGKRGFLQYQFVIPSLQQETGLVEIIKKISSSRLGSFLGVLKILGPTDHLLSFGMNGYTLALDFPVTNKLFFLLDELDKIVVAYGGRIYLAKDARMKTEVFRESYPGRDRFRDVVIHLNDDRKFESLLSKRLAIV